MFDFFVRNDLISQNQSGFKLGNSCINQLLAITYEIYKSFDACLDARAVFLDIFWQSLAPVSSLQIETERYFG